MTSVNSIFITVTTTILLFILVKGAPMKTGAESKVAESNPKVKSSAEKELQELADGEKALSRVPKVRGDKTDAPEGNKGPVETNNDGDAKRSRAAALFKTRLLNGKGPGNKREPEAVVKGPRISSRIPPSLRSQAKRQQQASVSEVPPLPELKAEAPLDVDLSPRAVAEYLLLTSDFNGFETALVELQASGIMSPLEVREYKNAVNWEFRGLLQGMMDVQTPYGQVPEKEAQVVEPRVQQVQQRSGKSSGKTDNVMDTPAVDLPTELKKLHLRDMMEREATVDQLLQTIIDDYYWRLPQQKGSGRDAQNQDEKQLQQLMDLLNDALGSDKSSEEKVQRQNKQDAVASKAHKTEKEVTPKSTQPTVPEDAKKEEAKKEEKKSEKRATA